MCLGGLMSWRTTELFLACSQRKDRWAQGFPWSCIQIKVSISEVILLGRRRASFRSDAWVSFVIMALCSCNVIAHLRSRCPYLPPACTSWRLVVTRLCGGRQGVTLAGAYMLVHMAEHLMALMVVHMVVRMMKHIGFSKVVQIILKRDLYIVSGQNIVLWW